MGVTLALASAIGYGLADFAGGLLSRRAAFVAIAFIGQISGFILSLGAVLIFPAPLPTPADLGWGALSGVGTGVGMVFLYRGLSHGDMSVVVPVSAVGGVALPVIVGFALLDDRPSALAWLGIAMALPAIWLISRARTRPGAIASAATTDGLVASIGIAVQYIALAQAGTDAGLWPIVAGRLAATMTIAPWAIATKTQVAIPPRLCLVAAATGVTAAVSLVFYMFATREQLMTIAVVLSSLYPAIPVVLGLLFLGERLNRNQIIGLGAAAAAVLLIAGE